LDYIRLREKDNTTAFSIAWSGTVKQYHFVVRCSLLNIEMNHRNTDTKVTAPSAKQLADRKAHAPPAQKDPQMSQRLMRPTAQDIE
jgi:hypothetical protein